MFCLPVNKYSWAQEASLGCRCMGCVGGEYAAVGLGVGLGLLHMLGLIIALPCHSSCLLRESTLFAPRNILLHLFCSYFVCHLFCGLCCRWCTKISGAQCWQTHSRAIMFASSLMDKLGVAKRMN